MLDFRDILWWLSLFAELYALGTLLARDLAGRYRFFAAYLCFDLNRDLVLSILGDPQTSPLYRAAWMISEPIVAALSVLVAYEFFSLIGAHYRNFAVIGRRLLTISLVGATIVCAATLKPDLHGLNWKTPWLQLFFVEKRYINSVLAVFLGFSACFFTVFRVPLRRNVVVHGRLLAILFVSTALEYLVINATNGSAIRLVNMGESLIAIACFALWSFLMTAAGERVIELPPVTAEEAAGLTASEQSLLKAARRVKIL